MTVDDAHPGIPGSKFKNPNSTVEEDRDDESVMSGNLVGMSSSSIDVLVRELTEYRKRNDELSTELKKLRAGKLEIRAEIHESMSDLRRTIATLEAEIKVKDERHRFDQNEIEELSSQLEAQYEKNVNSNLLAQLRLQLDTLGVHVETLQQEIKLQEAETVKRQSEILALKNQSKLQMQPSEEILTLQRKLTSQMERNAVLGDERFSLLSELTTANEQISLLKDSNRNLKLEVKSGQLKSDEELAQRAKEICNLKLQMSEAQSKCESICKDVAKLMAESDIKEDTILQLKDTIGNLKSSQDARNLKLQTMQGKIEQQALEIEEQTITIQELMSEFAVENEARLRIEQDLIVDTTPCPFSAEGDDFTTEDIYETPLAVCRESSIESIRVKEGESNMMREKLLERLQWCESTIQEKDLLIEALSQKINVVMQINAKEDSLRAGVLSLEEDLNAQQIELQNTAFRYDQLISTVEADRIDWEDVSHRLQMDHEREVSTLHQEIVRLSFCERDYKRLTESFEQLEAKLQTSRATIHKQLAHIHALESGKVDVGENAFVDGLKRQLEITQSALRVKNAYIDELELESELLELRKEKQRLENHISQMLDQNMRLISQLELMGREFKGSEEVVRNLKEEVSSLVKENSKLRLSTGEINDPGLANARTLLRESRERESRYREELLAREAEITNFIDQISRLEEELERSETELHHMTIERNLIMQQYHLVGDVSFNSDDEEEESFSYMNEHSTLKNEDELSLSQIVVHEHFNQTEARQATSELTTIQRIESVDESHPETSIFDLQRNQLHIVAKIRSPQLEEEGRILIETSDKQKLSVVYAGASYEFNFDQVCGPNFPASEICSDVSSLLECCQRGEDVSLIGFGTKSSGKRKAMFGVEDGILPVVMMQIFQEVEDGKAGKLSLLDEKQTVDLGILEIRNDQVYDLLSQTPNSACDVLISDEGRACVPDLVKVEVGSVEDIMHFVNMATAKQSAPSKSHLLVQVSFNDSDAGRIHFVDLAKAEESENIGLVSLRECLSALKTGFHPAHYLKSNLTKVLCSALSRNGNACLFVHISPMKQHIDATIQSLTFIRGESIISGAKLVKHEQPQPGQILHPRTRKECIYITQNFDFSLFSGSPPPTRSVVPIIKKESASTAPDMSEKQKDHVYVAGKLDISLLEPHSESMMHQGKQDVTGDKNPRTRKKSTYITQNLDLSLLPGSHPPTPSALPILSKESAATRPNISEKQKDPIYNAGNFGISLLESVSKSIMHKRKQKNAEMDSESNDFTQSQSSPLLEEEAGRHVSNDSKTRQVSSILERTKSSILSRGKAKKYTSKLRRGYVQKSFSSKETKV